MQIILYDTPGVIKKEMHKLDSMMMKNVRSAIGSADCVLVVADACKAPEKVRYCQQYERKYKSILTFNHFTLHLASFELLD